MLRSRTIRWVLLVAAIAALGYFGWEKFHGGNHLAQAHARKSGPAQIAVPVKIASVEKADFPVYLTGLGTVQGFNTVQVRTRVDGQIDKITFQEGQFVKQGDTLVEIDPRPFQAALDQAKAKKAQDQAQLTSAEKDLSRSKTLVLSNITSQQIVDQQQAKVDQFKASIAADDAAIQTAQTQLEYATITAPSDGRIGVRLVDPGNIVHANDQASLATLVLTRPSARAVHAAGALP